MKLLTALDVAKAAKCDVSYIRRLCRQGKIKSSKFSGSWMITFNDARIWLHTRKL